ncbi:methyltransferase domain protein [Leptospira inadai serovar Lyme str. 10]|uniref:Methyltransferase domain protein n=2 Tax=Leptospira inadai serovar Lyme TaxID=293084 RepID=V6HSF2_9LEPT|nr:class I SAM-dependent methyltransferase [Leptospira inadai]EQA35529.1 methyltransferase domain protein [Leptospira inadai serovar Lyme str. 10]PNV76153.1 class I SAM-dependent methyltransferase [Leptospira inadai serovar Lyme]
MLEKADIFKFLSDSKDGVYSSDLPKSIQLEEIKLRSEVAAQEYTDYLFAISTSHSIPVMDLEVAKFLRKIPKNGIILDIGGAWGWHWRNIKNVRPDVSIVIIDFIRENLVHAKKMVGPLIGDQVFLVHGDATSLPFPDQVFDAVWTVQTFQHIPDFKRACEEAYRILKVGGIFVNYSLLKTPLIRFIFSLFGKKYHIEGEMPNKFYLARANKNQKNILSQVFKSKVTVKYSECFFHPELRTTFTGRKGSLFGKLDYLISKIPVLNAVFARQASFSATKK